MPEQKLSDHPLYRYLIDAYRHFRAGDTRAALDVLKPVVEGEELANQPSLVTSMLWGLTGDCYFRLGEPDPGFRAYRQSIQLDSEAGCLALFACQVAWHERGEYAREALECLRAARRADRKALWNHPVHFLRHSLGMGDLYIRFVRMPLVRLKLRRLAARSQGR